MRCQIYAPANLSPGTHYTVQQAGLAAGALWTISRREDLLHLPGFGQRILGGQEARRFAQSLYRLSYLNSCSFTVMPVANGVVSIIIYIVLP